jgi:hypothetical protein
MIIFNIITEFYNFIERPAILNYEFHKFYHFKNRSSFFGVFTMLSNESLLDSYGKRACSSNTQSPEVERLFFFPDHRTRFSQVPERVHRRCSSVLDYSVEWHPFQSVDSHGDPKRKDLLDSFSKFVFNYGVFKTDRYNSSLLSEEIKISFIVCSNWLNHARLVSYTHRFWYLEFKGKDFKIFASMRAFWHSCLFLWTFLLSTVWPCLFPRHGLLEVSPKKDK